MLRIRSLFLAAVAALALLAVPSDAQAQLKFGAHVAYGAGTDSFTAVGEEDGTFGLGARVGFGLPAFPLTVLGTVDYFFVDCGDVDCGYQNFAVDANWAFLPLQIVELYATGGILMRRASVSGSLGTVSFDESNTETGFSLGAGVSFNLIASAYLEARNEFFSDDKGGNQILIRLGLLF
jgi:hypothetical protein